MEAAKRMKLEKLGWTVGDTSEFLELSPEEAALIETKLRLAAQLKVSRQKQKLSQKAFAEKLKSSQSRVAKMEAGDPSVSVDLIMKALFTLGLSPKQVGKVMG